MTDFDTCVAEPTREDREAALRRYCNGVELDAGGPLSQWVVLGDDALLGSATSLEMIGYAKGLAAAKEQHRSELADAEQAGFERGRRDAVKRELFAVGLY